MERYSIDRIENGLVTLVGEDGRERLIDALLFEQEPMEGDIVVMRNGCFAPLPDETHAARTRNSALLRRLLAQQQCFEKDKDRDDSEIGDSVEFRLPPRDGDDNDEG